MKLVCKCFNVKVMTNSEMPINEFHLDLQECERIHTFFHQRVYEVSPGGLKESLSCLMKGQVVGSWNIRQCKSCKLLTHAINCKSGLIVSSCLMLEANSLTWNDAPNYCQVFQILVPRAIADADTDEFALSGEDESVVLAEKKCKGYIDKATEETMAKIALYEAQHLQKLEQLKTKVYQELTMVKKLLWNIKEQEEQEAASSAAARMIQAQDGHQAEVDRGNDISDDFSGLRIQPDPHVQSSSPMFTLGEDPRMEADTQNTGTFEMDDDIDDSSGYGVFEMDGFNTTRQRNDRVPPDFEFRGSRRVVKDKEEGYSLMAQSAPMIIPKFESMYRTSRDRGINEEDMGDDENIDIGASIQKLAKSMRISSSDVFGDLPRPKLRRDL